MSPGEIGRNARVELDLTGKAFDMLEEAMMAEMFNTAIEHTAKREKLFFGVRALRMVRQALAKAAAEGDAIEIYQQAMAEAGFTKP